MHKTIEQEDYSLLSVLEREQWQPAVVHLDHVLQRGVLDLTRSRKRVPLLNLPSSVCSALVNCAIPTSCAVCTVCARSAWRE